MEKFIVNPKNYKEKYLENLNECFSGWGGDSEYDWSFKRKIGENSSDLLLIENEEDGVIAGSAVSYRTLSDGKVLIDIGIMTGSWTLPAARRKGCFTKMINCSKDLCEKRNVPFLTAFVTETNPSSRRLEAEGSYMLPTYHLFSPDQPFEAEGLPNVEILPNNEKNYHTIYDTVLERQSGILNFKYGYKEFVGQYLERIKQTTILKINDDFAILEDGVNEVKVLLITSSGNESLGVNVQSVTNWCLHNKFLRAFFFTTSEEFKQTGQDLNFQIAPGYFTILNALDEKVDCNKLFNGLNINMADKM